MHQHNSDESQKPLEGFRILVVDDEPDSLTFIATVLEDNGATVLQAQDGDAALNLVRKEKKIHLMTLDLAMPGKNGVDVYIELRDDPELRHLPVCIITGRPEMRKLIYERKTIPPPEGYMSKPITEKSLLINIRKILEIKEGKHGKEGPSSTAVSQA